MDQTDNKGGGNRPKNAGQSVLRGVIAAYLIYLGGSLIADLLRGSSTLKPLLVWIIAPLFVIAGLGFGFYTWKQWKAGQAEEKPAQQEPPEDV